MRLSTIVAIVATAMSLTLTACTGPQGPPGPAGPPGPPGGSSSAPYTWICAPAYFPQSGSNTRADLYVHNVSAASANVSVNILNKDGNNLVGQNIPGTSPAATYPGEANGTTVAVAANQTRIINWMTPQNSGTPGADISVTVRVVSDQPIVVASHFQFNPIGMPNVCHQAR